MSRLAYQSTPMISSTKPSGPVKRQRMPRHSRDMMPGPARRFFAGRFFRVLAFANA